MRTLVASGQIDAPPADVFEFFESMNAERYRAWHPEAHLTFRYRQGETIETGAVAHVEEVLHGDRHSYDIEYAAVVPDHLIEFRLTHPVWRLLMPRVRLEFRDSGEGCHFVQKVYLRSGPLSNRSERVQRELAAVERHMAEEVGYLTAIVENDRVAAIDAGEYPVGESGADVSAPQQVNPRTA